METDNPLTLKSTSTYLAAPPLKAFLASPTAAKFHAMFFRAKPNDNCADNEYDQREEAHGTAIAQGMRHARLEIRAAGCDQHAELISQPRKKAAQRIGRQLVDVRRNHAPRALHHELHQESSGQNQRKIRREHPRGNE